MKKCLDEATIQAYVDGELPAPSARAAARHLAGCEACAAALAEAEREAALFASAFAPDASVAVPTEVLRARVSAAVARLEAAPEPGADRARGWGLGVLLAPFTGLLSFTPQRAAAFASVLALVAFGVVFYTVRERATVEPRQEIARVTPSETQPAAPVAPDVVPNQVDHEPEETNAPVIIAPTPRIKRTPAPRRATPPRASVSDATVAASPTPEPLVPGEKNYREAIASLEKAVGVEADEVLAPKARIQYERNIAVLDRAIEETRRAALRNPKDKDAVGFLMAAYQSKVELLTAVAEQTQVAAIGR